MTPFTSRRHHSVAALGEMRLIAAIRRWLGDSTPVAPFGIGDDCAVLAPAKRHQLVTTDPVIYGQHFDDEVPARSVGAKLLKRNLSDIAAMGGIPRTAVVSMALAPDTSVAWVRMFYLGLAAAARRTNVKIVGGDIAQAPDGFLGAFLTLHGESSGPRVVTRRGAQRGDWIYVTGRLGGSLLGKHYRISPRLAEGAWLARRREVRAMLDVSDGLVKDLIPLTPAGTVPAVFAKTVPISGAAKRRARITGRSPLSHALCDGEDFELLFAVSSSANLTTFERAWQRTFPRLRLSRLGYFARRQDLPATALRLGDYHGYEHLR
ncbi:MAG: thiamine-phosphate kinase [Opitutaceae bacterium]|nr:thiamine-phosphate kinase [Opitutaceae bacterium]